VVLVAVEPHEDLPLLDRWTCWSFLFLLLASHLPSPYFCPGPLYCFRLLLFLHPSISFELLGGQLLLFFFLFPFSNLLPLFCWLALLCLLPFRSQISTNLFVLLGGLLWLFLCPETEEIATVGVASQMLHKQVERQGYVYGRSYWPPW